VTLRQPLHRRLRQQERLLRRPRPIFLGHGRTRSNLPAPVHPMRASLPTALLPGHRATPAVGGWGARGERLRSPRTKTVTTEPVLTTCPKGNALRAPSTTSPDLRLHLQPPPASADGTRTCLQVCAPSTALCNGGAMLARGPERRTSLPTMLLAFVLGCGGEAQAVSDGGGTSSVGATGDGGSREDGSSGTSLDATAGDAGLGNDRAASDSADVDAPSLLDVGTVEIGPGPEMERRSRGRAWRERRQQRRRS
jgi:hypothetical protein